jgi:hypothetical protein
VKPTRLPIVASPMLRKTLWFHKLKAMLQCNLLHSSRRCLCNTKPRMATGISRTVVILYRIHFKLWHRNHSPLQDTRHQHHYSSLHSGQI